MAIESRGILNRMNVDLRQLRYFVAIAEELSFRQAAEKLLITQPALSESIHELEIELGAELFARSGRRVSLTWPGVVLLDEARRILRITEDALRLTREVAAAGASALRVGVVEGHQPGLMSKALARARHLLPELRLTLYVLPTAVQLRALAADHIDVGLVVGSVAVDGVAVELLWWERLVAAMPRGHALAGHSGVTLSELRDLVFVPPDPTISPGYHERLVELCRGRGFEPRHAGSAFHLETWLNLVGSGFGIGLIPASVDTTRHPDIAAVTVTDADATIPIMAAWRTADPPPALSAFLAALKSSRPAAEPSSHAFARGSPPPSPDARRANAQMPDPPRETPKPDAATSPSDRRRSDGSR
jgi:DNA-binding transcriptional LysR family regulator